MDLPTGRAIPLTLKPRQQSVPSLQFTPDGVRLLIIGDGKRNLRDAAKGDPVWGPIAHSGDSKAVRFSPDGRRFAVFGAEDEVNLFETATGKLEHSLQHRGWRWMLSSVRMGGSWRRLHSS